MSATMSTLFAHLDLITKVEEGVEKKRMMEAASETFMKFLKELCFGDFSG